MLMREAGGTRAMRRRETKAKGTVAPEEDRPIEARDVDLWKEEEMLPDRAEQVEAPSREGNEHDTAGAHGPMAPEAARGLERASEK